MEMDIVSQINTSGLVDTMAPESSKGIAKAEKGFQDIMQELQQGDKGAGKDDQNGDLSLDSILLQLLMALNAGLNSSANPGPISTANLAWDVEADIYNLQQNTPLAQMVYGVLSDGEMGKLWKQLVEGFLREGQIDKNLATKFFQALKAKNPEIAQMSLDSFLGQLKNLIVQKADNIKTIGESEASSIIKKSTEEGNTSNYTNFTVTKNKKSYTPQGFNEEKQVNQVNQEIKKAKFEVIGPNGKEDGKEDGKGVSIKELNFNPVAQDSPEQIKQDVVNKSSPVLNAPSLEMNYKMPPGNMDNIKQTGQLSREMNPLQEKAFDQIVDSIRLAFQGEKSQLSIKLKPEYLGNVLVKVFSEGNNLRAELFIENAYIHEALQYHAQELKNQMQQQGYNLTDVNIYQMTSEGQTGNFYNQNFHQNDGTYHFKKYINNYRPQEGFIEEVAAKERYFKWGDTGSVNYVV